MLSRAAKRKESWPSTDTKVNAEKKADAKEGDKDGIVAIQSMTSTICSMDS